MRWTILRWAFLLAVLGGAWFSWRDSGEEVRRALGELEPWRVLVAGGLVLVGLLATGAVWRLSLGAFGVRGSARELVPPFFVAQLGKYIPGSVWSFAAQAVIGRQRGLAPRVAATSSVLFLGVHVASGLLLAGIVGWVTEMPAWLLLGSVVTGVVGLVPAVHRTLGGRLAAQACDWDLRRSLRGLGLMMPTWVAYALALAVLAPPWGTERVFAVGAAFAVAHAAGVAIPLAPAGLGAREAVLILILGPVLGAGEATMLALVARLLHFLADLVAGGASWLFLHLSAARHTPEATARRH